TTTKADAMSAYSIMFDHGTRMTARVRVTIAPRWRAAASTVRAVPARAHRRISSGFSASPAPEPPAPEVPLAPASSSTAVAGVPAAPPRASEVAEPPAAAFASVAVFDEPDDAASVPERA